MENERNRILFGRQKEQILAEVRTEIQKHEFQADSDPIEGKLIILLQVLNNPDEINYYFKNNYQKKSGSS